jgi:hypothetical protein
MDIISYYCCSTTVLVVMPDPAVPDFPGEMVSSSNLRLPAAIQSMARKMVRRIIARYWDTKFKETNSRLIPRSISEREDIWAAHTAMPSHPFKNELENQWMHFELALSARRIHGMGAEIQGWAATYNKATEAVIRANQEVLHTKMILHKELARRAAAEENLADTQADLELAKNYLDFMEEEEETHLNDIAKLEKRVKELED